MRRFSFALHLIIAHGIMLIAPTAAAWTMSGSNTLRVETYQVDGDENNSPYAHEGHFISNDLDFSLFGQPDSGQELRLDFAGTMTNSPYRSPHAGLSPEVMRLSYDNSTNTLPFQVDLGDQNVSLSELTLNRTLKAGRLTLRPDSGRDGRSYRISAVAGYDSPSWRNPGFREKRYRGASVGMQDQRLGSYGAHVVHYDHNALDELPSTSEWAASLNAQREFDAAGQDLNVRGELAHSQGQASPTSTRSDKGYFLQLDGSSQFRPLDYRFRYDRYGRGFRPSGSDAVADSETMLAEAGWRFRQDGQLRGRLHRTHTDLSGGNPIWTNSAGVNISGGMLAANRQRLIGRLDLGLKKRASAKRDIDLLSRTALGGMDFNHSSRHQTRLNASISAIDDLNSPRQNRRTRHFAANHRASFMFHGVDFTISPGISVTEIETRESETTTGPVLSVSAAREHERLVVELSRSEVEATDANVDQKRLSISYEIQRGQHSLGIDMDRTTREPIVGEQTDSWRAGMYWRYDFSNEFG